MLLRHRRIDPVLNCQIHAWVRQPCTAPVAALSKSLACEYLSLGNNAVNGCGLQSLGADEAVDYTSTDLSKRFADAPFDLVIDPVGGDTELKSYAVLGPNGTHSHITNRNSEEGRAEKNNSEWTDGKKYAVTLLAPDGEQLAQVAPPYHAGQA